jgi:hypothetical protein
MIEALLLIFVNILRSTVDGAIMWSGDVKR